MRIFPSLACFLILGGLASLAAATGEPAGLECPAQISVEQKAVSLPVGWTVGTNAAPHRLEMVTFFDGPPEELASLVYDDVKTAGKESTAVWRFAANPRGFWISCGYSGTAVVLSRRLPVGLKECRVTYEKMAQSAAGLPAIKKIDCR
jgi:hypothetical protein